jgi:hypothetical protein
MYISAPAAYANVQARAAVAPVQPAHPAQAAVIETRTAGLVPAPASAQIEIVIEANATTRDQAAQYDNRVMGATETVRGFDRIAMVEQGFEHIRELFAMSNPEGETGTGTDATAQPGGAVDIII